MPYTVPTPKGEEISLKDYEGKVILIVNTATGCGFTPHYKPIEEMYDIVNTATGCGFTPHYKPIEQMYEDFHDKGFEVIDVPCNQFAGQTPGTDEEIHDFCTLKYKTQFPQMKKSDVNGENQLMKKSDVNGENQLPLFKYLKEQKGFEGFGKGPAALAMKTMLKKMDKDYESKPDIKWNFTKFVVDREGNVVKRFEPTADMKEVRKFVESLI